MGALAANSRLKAGVQSEQQTKQYIFSNFIKDLTNENLNC